LEAIRGYLVLAINLDNNNKLNGEVFNFGPTFSQDKNVISLVSEMKKHWNKVLWKVKIRKLDLYESKLLRLSSKKAKKVLHWEPALKFNETIKMTTNWYKNYYDNKSNIFKFSKEQIEKYSLKMKLLKIKKNK
jgi:CDP-glucose 4,6-dehydratase